jgi:hypothetical protein
VAAHRNGLKANARAARQLNTSVDDALGTFWFAERISLRAAGVNAQTNLLVACRRCPPIKPRHSGKPHWPKSYNSHASQDRANTAERNTALSCRLIGGEVS